MYLLPRALDREAGDLDMVWMHSRERVYNFYIMIFESGDHSNPATRGTTDCRTQPHKTRVMPPLQDITHKFVSPLPPSSSPALSYIDEVENKINPSEAFLALPTSPAHFIFSTPKAKLTLLPGDSDPFGFL